MTQATSERFEIHVKGHLDRSWSECFSGLDVINTPSGETVLVGPIVDQAELHGVLAGIRDLNLTLLSVTRIDSGYAPNDDQHGEDAQMEPVMNGKRILSFVGKLLLGGITFIVGAVIGSLVASLLGLQPPPMPEGVDGAYAFVLLALESPLLILALALLAVGLGGRLLLRALVIAFFVWVTYALNTAIESLAFTTTTVSGALFTTVSFLAPSMFCGLVVAWLFPSGEQPDSLGAHSRRFFGRRTAAAWLWRIGLAAFVFAPIYIFFGAIVAPLTAEYFQQNMFGLRQPSQSEMFLVLLVRSVLFFCASLPIFILWQRSNRELFLKLGFALFTLVGFLYMLGAYYMPLDVRVPHTLEILAGSLVYAGMLVALLASDNRLLVRTLKARTT